MCVSPRKYVQPLSIYDTKAYKRFWACIGSHILNIVITGVHK